MQSNNLKHIIQYGNEINIYMASKKKLSAMPCHFSLKDNGRSLLQYLINPFPQSTSMNFARSSMYLMNTAWFISKLISLRS